MFVSPEISKGLRKNGIEDGYDTEHVYKYALEPGKVVKCTRARAGVARCVLPHKGLPGKRGWVEKKCVPDVGITVVSDKTRSNKSK